MCPVGELELAWGFATIHDDRTRVTRSPNRRGRSAKRGCRCYFQLAFLNLNSGTRELCDHPPFGEAKQGGDTYYLGWASSLSLLEELLFLWVKGTRYPGSVDLCLTRGGFSLSNCRSQGRPITFGYRVKSLSPAASGRERKAISESC